MTLVKHHGGYSVKAKVSHKKAKHVRAVIIEALKLVGAKAKPSIDDNTKKSSGLKKHLAIFTIYLGPLPIESDS